MTPKERCNEDKCDVKEHQDKGSLYVYNRFMPNETHFIQVMDNKHTPKWFQIDRLDRERE